MAALYRRGKKRIWWIKYYANRRAVYRSLRTTDARVAERIKRQIEGEEAKGELLAPSKTPLPAFLQDFCQHLSTIRTRKSYSADVSALRVFFGPICPAMELGTNVNRQWRSEGSRRIADTMQAVHVKAEFLEQITGARIESFITQRMRDDGIAPKTANRYREILHKMFNYAAKHWNFVPTDRRHPNPAALVERRREPARTIRFLTLEQIEQQLEVLKKRLMLQVMVATFIYAGLRREEAMWLTHADVDLERRLIYVRAKTIDGESWQPKTKRNRVVPISDTLAAILGAYRPPAHSMWFFPAPHGQRWDPDNFSQDLRKINVEHDLPWSCLDYRHTFGSLLAQKGVSLYKIAELLGNSPEICRRHYAALIPEKMHDAVEFEDGPEKPTPTDALLRQVLAKLDELHPEKQAHLRLVK
jgi:integrase